MHGGALAGYFKRFGELSTRENFNSLRIFCGKEQNGETRCPVWPV
jgi:hypothetical protein